MNIAVICGGLSSERDVSITSGTNAARALREMGHKVVLVDLFYGYEGEYNDPKELFEQEQQDIEYSVKEETPDVEKLLADGDGSRIGKNVIEICRYLLSCAPRSGRRGRKDSGNARYARRKIHRQRLPRQCNCNEQGAFQDNVQSKRHTHSDRNSP